MIYYWSALIALLTVSLFPKASRPFAVVMLLNVAANEALISQGGSVDYLVPAVDAVAFIWLAGLTVFHVRKWWSFMVMELAFAAVVGHFLYGVGLILGLYLGQEYQIVLNGAFIVAAGLLAFGGYDIGQRGRLAWNDIALAYHLWVCDVQSRSRPIPHRREVKR